MMACVFLWLQKPMNQTQRPWELASGAVMQHPASMDRWGFTGKINVMNFQG